MKPKKDESVILERLRKFFINHCESDESGNWYYDDWELFSEVERIILEHDNFDDGASV
jgi:hypothetical protein